jgi:hypothetical protein
MRLAFDIDTSERCDKTIVQKAWQDICRHR